jgi:hypothetical protein
MQWMPVAVDCVRMCSACRVHAAREFELLPLWCYIVELVCDTRWLLEYSAAMEVLQAFTRSLSAWTASESPLQAVGTLWDNFGKEPIVQLQQPAMQLAGRAILVYLNHALDAKARGAVPTAASVDLSSGANELLRSQTATLLKAATSSGREFAGFEAFFSSIQAMSAPGHGPTPLADFKRELVRTLLPMAPYLCGF